MSCFLFRIMVQETQYIAGRLMGDGNRRHGYCLKLGNYVKQMERESLTNEEGHRTRLKKGGDRGVASEASTGRDMPGF